ncbi:midkine b isoform X2 [Micropterus salmoides]|uniref:midkine b isoform X2 n=1 Tax=Micropterus salmoides TaxID=27706 RepID=UPI0018EB8764|nr:midkine b isoform X2 [Micropterus salmoides]
MSQLHTHTQAETRLRCVEVIHEKTQRSLHLQRNTQKETLWTFKAAPHPEQGPGPQTALLHFGPCKAVGPRKYSGIPFFWDPVNPPQKATPLGSTGCSFELGTMRSLFSVTLLLLLALTLAAEANKRAKAHKGKNPKSPPECSPEEVQYGKCVPQKGDCGDGLRDVSCKDLNDKIHCKIPCNWKKDISDCKYKFGQWGSCDANTNTKSRSGTLKRALFNADCLATVKVTKPCSPKVKKTRGDKKSN